MTPPGARPGASGPYRRPPLSPHELTAPVTPASKLFVLAHFGVVHVESASWTLEIDGLVRRRLRLTLEDLRRYPRMEVQSFHECAGNPLAPTVPQRRIANVIWGGVNLRALLSETGVDPAASHVWSYGIDHGEFAGTHSDSYLKDLPLTRLTASADVLVAYELNGEPLSDEHGAPARLVVPGWYGTNSVKWLRRIRLADRRADGPFTTTFYNDVVNATPDGGAPRTTPVWQVAPESVIVRPAIDQVVPRGTAVEVWGWAWAGAPLRGVEVSLDGGATWRPAAVESGSQRSWRRFGLRWLPRSQGPTELLSRATDVEGLVQPRDGARNAIYSVPVVVADAPG